MPRDVLRFALITALSAASGCSIIVDSTLSSKDDGGAPADTGVHPDASHDAGADAGPDLGSDAGPACATVCGLHSTCDAAMHACTCDMGFTLSGTSCVDVNECTAHTDTCAMNALCENTPGSFLCHCFPGATGDGMTCAAPTVLILTDAMAMNAVQNGAMRAGTIPTVTTDAATFVSMLSTGTWSAIYVTSITSPSLDMATVTAINTYVAGGGKAVMSHYEVNTFPTLASAFEVTTTAYMGATTVTTDTTTTPDFFNQQEVFPSPLAMHTTTFFTEGVRLTPVGSAFAVASLGGGGSAIVIGNHGNTIINGFTISESVASATPDADGDGLNDASELVTNELDYLLRPHVLLYYDAFESPPPPGGAVGGLHWSQFLVRDSTNFDRVYDRGGFDVMFVASSENDVGPTNQTRISAWSATVGKTLFSYWHLAGAMPSDTTVLRSALDVMTATPFMMARPVVADATTPTDFFTFHDTFPSPLTTSPGGFGIDGTELVAMTPATSFAAAEFDSATGPVAILVTRSGKTVVDGFLSGDFTTVDNDADLVPDIQELFSNELLYLMTRP